MDKLVEFINRIADSALTYLSVMSIKDVFDIIFVGIVIYLAFKFIKGRRAGKLIVGVLILAVVNLLCSLFQLSALGYVLELVFENGLLAIVILFQPELRSMLEAVGTEPIKSLKRGINIDQNKYNAATVNTINELCEAVVDMAKTKTGALIVIERDTKIDDISKSGEYLDAHITKHLIKNIFFKNSPLHDGAMVIRNNRIDAAGCLLPLSDNLDIIRDLGTRHRAGIGMSEKSDAIVIIVSEETGNISVALNGIITRNYVHGTLYNYLTQILVGKNTKTGKSPANKFITSRTKSKKKGNDN